jgi:hypothetical protein
VHATNRRREGAFGPALDRDRSRHSARYRRLEVYRFPNGAAATDQNADYSFVAVDPFAGGRVSTATERRGYNSDGPPLKLVRYRLTAFVGVDEGEHRFDFGAAGHTRFFLAALKRFGNFVVPTALPHELVPNVSFFFGRLPPHAESPMENFIVAAALFYPLDQLVVIDAEEAHAGLIKTFAQIGLILRMQLVFAVRADFVQHSSEVDDASDFRERAAEFLHQIEDSPFRVPFQALDAG